MITYVCMDGWIDGWMDGWMYVCMCVCTSLALFGKFNSRHAEASNTAEVDLQQF